MFLELFLFAEKMKYSTKGGIHCVSRSSRGTFVIMREHSLVELTNIPVPLSVVTRTCNYLYSYEPCTKKIHVPK